MHSNHSLIEPAIMADEWESLVTQIDSVAQRATHIQIDVMDGRLVPSVSFPYNTTNLENKKIPHSDTINVEVHLMVENPHEIGTSFIHAGAKRIVAQIEGFLVQDAQDVFREWKEAGAEVGVSLLLDTPLEDIAKVVTSGNVSMVQVMSIARIGYQGEEFDTRALMRVKELRELYPDVIIAVDGGVNADTLEALFNAGVNVFGIGSAIMKAQVPEEELERLQNLLKSYVTE